MCWIGTMIMYANGIELSELSMWTAMIVSFMYFAGEAFKELTKPD